MSTRESVTVRCTILEERDISMQIEQAGSYVRIPRSGCVHISKRDSPMASSIVILGGGDRAKVLLAHAKV